MTSQIETPEKRQARLERMRVVSRRHYLLNRERIIAATKVRQQANRPAARAAYRRWEKKNLPVMAAKAAAYHAGLKTATPAWANRDDLKFVYEMAALFGVTVDHIYPLKGENSCGLHVPWNLQLLPGDMNSGKGNRSPVL